MRCGDDSWIRKCQELKVEGEGKRGTLLKNWEEVLRKDLINFERRFAIMG